MESSVDQTGGASDASASSLPRGKDFFGKFILYALVFGVVSAVLSSKLPVAIGAILFVSNDDFIAWVLRKVGIQLVPDSLGANFISACVFLTTAWVLLAYCRESLPASLSSAVPASFSWAMVGVGALGCAALAFVATAATRLLPRVGIHVRPDSVAGALTRGVIGFSILGLLYLVLSTPMASAWLGVN
ncbi:MAG: hypothetical protein JWN71_2113 [Xanthobacteraceae bacterium]|nr:hypothetical protein [Xanthobacteraceae bacterium]